MESKIKAAVVLVACLLFRLLPFRPPNVEPILASQMPLARHGGALAGFFFGVLSILLYDIVTGTLGPWTVLTASAYGVLGLGAVLYFNSHFVTPSQSPPLKGGEEEQGNTHTPPRAKPRVLPLLGENKIRRRHYVYFAITGTLFYDAATGLTVGPLFFNQPFMAAVLGQIPFTLMHLLGNISFAILLSPLVERWLAVQPQECALHLLLPKIRNLKHEILNNI